MAHVLIGFAEALAAPESFFSLHRAGHTVSAFARPGSRAPAARHLPLHRLHALTAPESDAAAATAELAALLTGPEAPEVVLPLDDAALWLVTRALEGMASGGGDTGEGVRIAGGTGAAARVALDKSAQIAAAARAGLAVPDTVTVRAPGDLRAALPLPAIAKPALAVSPRGAGLDKGRSHILAGPDDAAALAESLDPHMAPLLVQPLIRGTGEGVFGFAGAGGVSHWSGHRRLRMMNPHGSGSSACISARPEPALRDAVAAFIADIGWRGPFMVELLRDGAGTAWFMELNGRMWGSLALARGQGLEYPAWAVAQARDPDFVPPAVGEAAEPLVARHLGRDLLHLLFVARGPKSPLYRADWPRLLPSMARVLRPVRGRRYNSDPDFPGFAWRDAAHTVAAALRRR